MPFDTVDSDLTVIPVTTKAELARFVQLANRLNAGDPNWVVPLMFERMAALTPKTNPFFQHADVQMWLAVRGGRDVGRISAQIDHLATQAEGQKTGNFGMIAAEDDPAIFTVLFRTAEDWLRARGCTTALGPFNLSINEEVGLLVDGFDTKPMVMMGHDPRYTAARVEEQGYAKAKDVYAYVCDPRRPAGRGGAARQARPARGRDPARAGHEPLRRGGQSPSPRSSTTPGRATGASCPPPRPRPPSWASR
jgi:hypothetical protein